MIEVRKFYILWWAIGVHAVWGVALLIDPGAGPLVILVGLHWMVAIGVTDGPLGGVLLAAAILASISLVQEERFSNRVALLLLMPQYMLLVGAMLADSWTIATGSIAGRDYDRIILLVALWPMIIGGILHSGAIIERHLQWTRR